MNRNKNLFSIQKFWINHFINPEADPSKGP